MGYFIVGTVFTCCGSFASWQLIRISPDCLKFKLFSSLPLFVAFYNQQEILGVYFS